MELLAHPLQYLEWRTKVLLTRKESKEEPNNSGREWYSGRTDSEHS